MEAWISLIDMGNQMEGLLAVYRWMCGQLDKKMDGWLASGIWVTTWIDGKQMDMRIARQTDM